MKTVFIVDEDLNECLKSFSDIVDRINQNNDFTQYLNNNELDLKDKNVCKEVITKVYSFLNSTLLKNLLDKEVESFFYQLIHILISLYDSTKVLEDINLKLYLTLMDLTLKEQPLLKDKKSIKITTIISIYNTIFNLMDETSRSRIFVIKQILNIVHSSNIGYILTKNKFGESLVSWLKTANATDEEIGEIFWFYINIDSKFNKKSLDLIKDFSLIFEINKKQLKNLIIFALKSDIIDVSFLITINIMKAINSNSDDHLVSIFLQYINGELLNLTDSELKEYNLKADFINSKSKILSLMVFFNKNVTDERNKENIFSHKSIPLVQSFEEFEFLIIGAIKAGVIEGRLNQVNQTFQLFKVNKFIFPNSIENQNIWVNVKNILQDWKSALSNNEELVDLTKKNMVISDSFN